MERHLLLKNAIIGGEIMICDLKLTMETGRSLVPYNLQVKDIINLLVL